MTKSDITELEWKLQQATADYLTGHIAKGIRVSIPFHFLKFHHPALEYRGAAEGAKYARRGTKPGIPDWLLWGPDRWHGMIELKVAGRELSAKQKEVHRWASEYGFPHAIAGTVTQFRDIIIGWGWECHNMAAREPEYATKEQKHQSYFDMMKPLK